MIWIVWLLVQDARLPVPEPSALKEAERLVREVFKEEYSRTSVADKRALARKLLEASRAPDNDAPTRYVLLRDAQVFGDTETGLKAVDESARLFRVDPLPLRHAVLAGALAPTPEEAKAVTEAWLALVDDALAAWQAEIADKAAQQAVALSRRSKDIPLASRAQAKAKQVAEVRARLDAVKKAEQVLASKPDDPGANTELGRHACLTRNEWTTGLAQLSKGISGPLQDLARRDLQGTADTPSQVALGDGWWDVAEKETATERTNARERALHWYGKAYAETSGLTRLKIDTRFKEMGRKLPNQAWTLGPFDLDERGFVRNWLVLGSFASPGGRAGREHDCIGGEANHVPRSGLEVQGKTWTAFQTKGHNLAMPNVPHLNMRPGAPNLIVYAACWLEVESDQDAEIRIGSDDGCKLWMNHQDFSKRLPAGGAKIDQVITPLKLTRGRHLLLAKVDQQSGPFEWMLRVVTPKGERAPGVRVWN